jgi:hypothetical protein
MFLLTKHGHPMLLLLIFQIWMNVIIVMPSKFKTPKAAEFFSRLERASNSDGLARTLDAQASSLEDQVPSFDDRATLTAFHFALNSLHRL